MKITIKEKMACKLLMFFAIVSLLVVPTLAMAAEEVPEADTDSASASSDIEDELFKKAMSDREAELYEESITAFHDILSADPTLHRARLELAVAYYKTLQYKKAIAQAQKVLEDPETPPNVRITILAFIAQSKKTSNARKKSTWRFPVSFGYIDDDNTNVGPSSSVLPGGWTMAAASLPQADHALEIGLGINHIYQTGKTFNIGGTPTALYTLSGMNLYNRNYFDEDTDLSVMSFRTGPALIAQDHWRALLNIQWDRVHYADDKLADYYTLKPSFTKHFPHGIEATTDIAFSRQSYFGSNSNRDSDSIAPRILVGYTSPSKTFAVQVAAQYFDSDAEFDVITNSERYSNDGTNLFLGATWNIKINSSIYASYNRKDVKYEGFEPISPTVSRDEDQHRITVGAKHKFETENIMFDEWTIGVKAVFTDNNSNVATTDYDRDQYSLNFSKTF